MQAETIAAVNEQRIPAPLQEELLGSVNALVESIECVVPPPAAEDDEDDEDDDEDRGEGKKKGKGKKEKDDD